MVDADLKGYFDNIAHERLESRIEEHISDGRLLKLLAGWIRQDIVKGMERWRPMTGPLFGSWRSSKLDLKIYGLTIDLVEY